MKQYTKLKLPPDSAWDRKTWRYYTPIWFNNLVDNVHNLIDWFPVIWRDRHWDDYYITKVLQRKIELQREYIVKHNRHTSVDEDNYWMTVVLNLIEREHMDYYSLEQYDFKDNKIEFVECADRPGSFQIKSTTTWENLDAYLTKYKGAVRRVMKKYPKKEFSDKEKLSLCVARYNQERSRHLMFEILKRYSARWWD